MRVLRQFAGLRKNPDILAASFAANILSFALPLLMLQIYDRIIPRQGLESLTVLAAGVGTAIVMEMLLRTARAHLMALAGDTYERRTQARMFERLLKADLAVIEKDAPGVYLDRITSLDRVRDFRHGESAMASLDLPFAFVFLFVVLLISPIMTGVIIALILAAFALSRRLRTHALALAEQKQDLDRRRYSFLIEVLAGIESIKSASLEPFMERRYERLLSTSAMVGSRATEQSSFAQAVTGSIGQITPVVIAAAGAVLVIQHMITVGALAAVILLATRIVQPVLKIEALRTGDEDIRRAEGEIDKVLAAPLPRTGKLGCDRLERLDLSGISYTPEGRKAPLFEGLDFSIERGQIISIDGAVGSGRSALLWMMMGYSSPDRGNVLINRRPMADFDPAALRRRIAYLPSKPRMLDGTVLENMTRYQPDIYLDDALDVATALGLDAYLSSHPEGLNMRVGHGLDVGLPVSVTERIPLVGALVGHPDLILFDEANANLDMDGDKRLRDFLFSRKGESAIVLVTQRPSYLVMADRHFIIEHGRLHPRDVALPPNAAPRTMRVTG